MELLGARVYFFIVGTESYYWGDHKLDWKGQVERDDWSTTHRNLHVLVHSDCCIWVKHAFCWLLPRDLPICSFVLMGSFWTYDGKMSPRAAHITASFHPSWLFLFSLPPSPPISPSSVGRNGGESLMILSWPFWRSQLSNQRIQLLAL